MVLSEYIDNTIEENYETIISVVPFRNILIRLRSIHILTSDQYKKLRKNHNNEDLAFDCIEILKLKDDSDFYQFCKILNESQIDNVQNFGQFLENAAITKNQSLENNPINPSKRLANSLEYLLRDLPLTPQSDYISRKQFNNIICDQLKQIDKSGGHILVHGMAGSGKTVAVCQAVRQLITEENYFKPYGCHWIKIGDISQQELLAELRGLATEIGVEDTKSISSLTEINSCIKKFFKDYTDMSNVLFVFDNIWNQEHFQYLTFAKKSIVTSRFNNVKNKNTHYCIAAPQNLTDDEAIQVLQKRQTKDNDYKLTNNVLVKDAIHSCKGLPLAVGVIAGLNLRSDEDWQNVIKTITHKDLEADVLLPDYDFNLFGTFQLSVDQLNEHDQQLFRSLGVFKPVQIPVQSVISMWTILDVSKDIVTTLLKKLHQRSLLRFVDSYSPSCVLHDLIIEYLQLSNDHRQSVIMLNKNLIDGYCNRCLGKWSSYPSDDYYYYQYLIHHAVQAEDHRTIEEIMRDFKWMSIKLQSDHTIFNLCVDIEKANDYLKRKEIENWKQYQQLAQLLQRYEYNLPIESIDLVQVLLTIDYNITWIKESALELALESDFEYWKIAIINHDKVERIVEPLKSKRIGKIDHDKRLAVSNPCYGNLRIIGTENNSEENCQVVIKDYETSKNIHQITVDNILVSSTNVDIEKIHKRRQYIDKVVISPDGSVVGFSLYGDGWRWKVYNVDNKEELCFMKDDIHKLQCQGFHHLKFCPVLHHDNIIIATLDIKQLKVWKIDGNNIRFINKQISIDYCIESIEWIDNGSKIMLWYRMYECKEYGKPIDRDNWINECQIQIWNLQPWHCLKSLSVPAYIIKRLNQHLPTIDVDEGKPLDAVYYINSNDGCLVLSYFSTYFSLCGLLALRNYDLKLWYDENALKNNFHPFPSFLHIAEDVNISSNQQLISCLTDADHVYVLKVVNDQLQSYIKIQPLQSPHHSLFIPENNRLLVYDISKSLCEYVVQEDNLGWKTFINEGNDDNKNHPRWAPSDGWIIDSGYAYISNNPVGVQLIKSVTCRLRVLNFQQQSCPTQFDCKLDQQYDKCYIFDDLQSAILIRTSNKKLLITQLMNFVLQSEDRQQQHKTLCQYNPPNNVYCIKVIDTRYRKTDHTLIVVMEEELEIFHVSYLTIVTINLCNGYKINYYKYEDIYKSWRYIYIDEFYLITQSEDLLKQKFVQCYQIGDDTNQSQRIVTQKYDKIACKITLPVNQSTGDLHFKSLPFEREFNKGDWIEHWGENDGHLFILNDFDTVLLEGNNEKRESFNRNISVSARDNLWFHKYWIVFNKQTQNIEMYEVTTMKLYRILPFHYFDALHFKWNQEQSSFVVFDSYDNDRYCVFKRV